jgi:hypothetical protein
MGQIEIRPTRLFNVLDQTRDVDEAEKKGFTGPFT